jgi:hypothetical protein
MNPSATTGYLLPGTCNFACRCPTRSARWVVVDNEHFLVPKMRDQLWPGVCAIIEDDQVRSRILVLLADEALR